MTHKNVRLPVVAAFVLFFLGLIGCGSGEPSGTVQPPPVDSSTVRAAEAPSSDEQ